MRQSQTSILLAAESLIAKNSGIGRVARLMAKVMSNLCEDHPFNLRGVSLSDPRDAVLDWAWVRPCGGDRLRYVLGVQSKGIMAREIFYDSLSMARAHFMGPARRHASLAWMHGVEVWEHARPDRLVVARRVGTLVTNSEYTRRRAASLHGGLERARVCWLGTESDNPLSIKDGGLPTVLILSRIDLDLHKGHQELIDAWPRVVERVPVAKLLVAGAGPGYDAVRDAIARSPVAGSIKLTGYVPEEQLPQLWSRATVFAMPSRGEGFGLTYIEAMRHGVPVIASRQDAGQEVNVHGVTGYNVNLDTPEDLSEALISLLSDPEKACVMGAAGRERWRRHFTYSVFKSRFLGLLSEEGLLSVPWNEPI